VDGVGRRKRSRGLNFGKKGKKESQVFTSVADNPRQCIGSCASVRMNGPMSRSVRFGSSLFPTRRLLLLAVQAASSNPRVDEQMIALKTGSVKCRFSVVLSLARSAGRKCEHLPSPTPKKTADSGRLPGEVGSDRLPCRKLLAPHDLQGERRGSHLARAWHHGCRGGFFDDCGPCYGLFAQRTAVVDR
jgi:hypothetical protein